MGEKGSVNIGARENSGNFVVEPQNSCHLVYFIAHRVDGFQKKKKRTINAFSEMNWASVCMEEKEKILKLVKTQKDFQYVMPCQVHSWYY